MANCGQTTRARSPWRVLLALVCVLLVVAAGTVQVAHSHADSAATHADCSLCAVVHINVQVGQSPDPAPAVAIVTVVEAAPRWVLPVAPSTFALFTRPPPGDIAAV